MGAVGGAEGVHDERVDEAGPFFAEFGVVLLFAGEVTGVLGEEDFAVLESFDGGFELFSPIRGAEGDLDVAAKGFGDVFLEGFDGDDEVVLLHLGIDVFLGLLALLELLPVDFAKVGHENDASAFFEEFLDGRDGGADAVVIGNDGAFVGDVEINADIDLLAVKVTQLVNSKHCLFCYSLCATILHP